MGLEFVGKLHIQKMLSKPNVFKCGDDRIRVSFQ